MPLQTCHEGEEPGEVVVRLRKQDILKVHFLTAANAAVFPFPSLRALRTVEMHHRRVPSYI